jgi:rubredoxin-NAD+ reductase
MADPLIIIGTGLAGYNLAREWRKLDSKTPLIIFSRDSARSYSKPMLSTGFQKSKSDTDLCMADAGKMAEQLQASIYSFSEVTNIDTDKRTITADDVSYCYRDLVLATGSVPIKLPTPNSATDATYAINDLDQYGAFRTAVKPNDHVLIVGGGLIGCEYANDLALAGHKVTLIEREDRLLKTLIHPEISEALKNHFEERGIKVHTSSEVSDVSKNESEQVVVSCSDSEFFGDVLLSAIGVKAEITLANLTGLTVNRGVVVDRSLQTSHNHIYALGDCAEVNGHSLFYVMPLMLGARALAKTLSGTPTEVSYPVMPITIKTTEYPIVSQLPNQPEVSWSIESSDSGITALCHNANNELVGFCLSGDAVVQRAKLSKEVAPLMP